MADGYEFKLNPQAIRQVLTSDQAHALALKKANAVCSACNAWADGQPRSGADHGETGPHFEVKSQPSKGRARYIIAPRTGFGYWLTRKRPLEFQALLEAGRG